MVINMWPIFLIIVFLLIILLKNREFNLKRLSIFIFFIVLTLIGVYVMTLSVAYAERVLSTPICFGVIAVGMLYNEVLNLE